MPRKRIRLAFVKVTCYFGEAMPKTNVPALVVYTIRMDRSKLDRLAEIAAREHRSLPGELRRLVDERIAVDDEQRGEAA